MAEAVKAVLDLVKSALWPATAVLAIFLFYVPIRTVLDNLSQRANDIEKVQLGTLELNYRVTDLPTPDIETAKVIVKLDEASIIEILSFWGGQPCYPGPLEQHPNYLLDKRLSDIALITMKPEAPTASFCEHPHSINLTDLGHRTRDFLLKLLATQLRKSGYKG